MTPSEVATLYRNQGREVPAEFRSGVHDPTSKVKEKFGRKKVSIDGKVFDSSGEAAAWSLLRLWERAGIITDLEVQPVFQLEPKFKLNGKTIRAIKYKADFIFTRDGKRVVVDFKGPKFNKEGKFTGVRTPVFEIKAKMFKSRFPEVVFELWDKDKVKKLSRY